MEIKVISRKTCPPCSTLKKWLHHHDIKFTEYDADERPELLAAIQKKTGYMTVPLTIIGNEIIPGLHFHKIRDLVNNGIDKT
jgi:glutaredoxin